MHKATAHLLLDGLPITFDVLRALLPAHKARHGHTLPLTLRLCLVFPALEFAEVRSSWASFVRGLREESYHALFVLGV